MTTSPPLPTLAPATKRQPIALEATPRKIKRPAKSPILTIVLWAALLYFLIPLVWLLISSTKSVSDLYSTFGLSFGNTFALFDNIGSVFTFQNGIFSRWILNTILYTAAGAAGATLLALLCGYALSQYRFTGRRIVLAVVLGAVMIPLTALTVPLYLLFSTAGITNTPWAVILPSLVNPFGVFLIAVYAGEAVDESLLEAARLDGSGEFRTLFTITSRILAPGIATVFLFSAVATWNNYFLPLVMLSTPNQFPLTVGLAQWQSLASAATGGGTPTTAIVLAGSVLSIIPLIVTFLLLQRFWVSGLTAGSTKG